MAEKGETLAISSLCTVFAESEVINYIGEGRRREDIAAGVVDSVAAKVAQLAMRKELPDQIILTGGLSSSRYFTKILSQKIGKTVSPTITDAMPVLSGRRCWRGKRAMRAAAKKHAI